MIKFKVRHFIWFLISIMIFCLFILAFNLKSSFINDTDLYKAIDNNNLTYFQYPHEQDVSHDFISNKNISTLNDLKNNSSLIVKASVDKDAKREMFHYCTLTKLHIEKIYKGSLNKDEIYIFEPFDILHTENQEDSVYSLDGYNIMKTDKDYILFLRDIKDSHYTNEKSIYLPTTTLLSKYPIDSSQEKVVDLKELIQGKYNNLINFNIASSKKNIVYKYNSFKTEILKEYK